jgi:hypothetical protein
MAEFCRFVGTCWMNFHIEIFYSTWRNLFIIPDTKHKTCFSIQLPDLQPVSVVAVLVVSLVVKAYLNSLASSSSKLQDFDGVGA